MLTIGIRVRDEPDLESARDAVAGALLLLSVLPMVLSWPWCLHATNGPRERFGCKMDARHDEPRPRPCTLGKACREVEPSHSSEIPIRVLSAATLGHGGGHVVHVGHGGLWVRRSRSVSRQTAAFFLASSRQSIKVR